MSEKEAEELVWLIPEFDPLCKTIEDKKTYYIPVHGDCHVTEMIYKSDWNSLMSAIKRICEKLEPSWTMNYFIEECICYDESYDSVEDLYGLFIYYLNEKINGE